MTIECFLGCVKPAVLGFGHINVHVVSFVACIVNGTRFRDGVKVLWCHSILVWWVFAGFIPKCACFCPNCIFCDLFLLLVLFTNGKKERREVGREAKGSYIQWEKA